MIDLNLIWRVKIALFLHIQGDSIVRQRHVPGLLNNQHPCLDIVVRRRKGWNQKGPKGSVLTWNFSSAKISLLSPDNADLISDFCS
jgi:hypothetical protein